MRYAIISDIHEDVVNLELALRKISKLKCDEIICLGDIAGFSISNMIYFNTRNASECIRLVKENCSIVIAGNHDLHAAKATPRIHPEFEYPENWYELNYHEHLKASGGKVWLYEKDELNPLLTRADEAYLSSLPEKETLKILDETIFLSHYFYPNLTGAGQGFYEQPEDFAKHREYMDKHQAKVGFTGHYHFKGLFIARENKVLEKRFGLRHKILDGDLLSVPPLCGKNTNHGFCIFDTDKRTAEARRI